MAGEVSKMQKAGGLLEDVRDYVKRKNHGDIALSLLLQKFWLKPGDKLADMSGLVCFVAVFRSIFCRLGLDTKEGLDDAIRQNGLLRFALSNFGSDDAKEQEARELMQAALTEELGCQPTFDNLAESDLVLKSMWAYHPFRLYYPILWQPGPDSPEWEYISDESRDLAEARKALIEWDTSEHSSLQDAVDAVEGVFRGGLEGAGDQVDFYLVYIDPLVLRVKVLFRDRIENFSMSDISKLRLPTSTQTIKERVLGRDDTGPPKTMRYRKVPGGQMYRLLAMVKLRAEGEEQDDVRVYDHLGCLVRPQRGRPGLEAFSRVDWSVEEQRHSVMLYYIRMPNTAEQFVDITDEYGGENVEAASTGTAEPGRESQAQRVLSLALPRGGDVGSWPAGGFSDDDSAAPYVIHVMNYRSNLAGPCLTLDDVKVVRNPVMVASDLRPYRQVARLCEDEADCNFWFPRPGRPGHKMGKVDCSAVGLATVVQALWTVVLNYDDAGSLPRLQEQIQPLVETDRAMDYVRPRETDQTYYVLAEPSKPEDIRSVLEALQVAARRSTAGYVIFYVDPVNVETRGGAMSAFVDVHPVTECEED